MHIEKETYHEAIIKLKHDLRQSENYKNKDIDKTKSNLNYDFNDVDPFQKFKERINQVYIYGKNGKNKDNINYLCSVVVQYPDNCPLSEEDFFIDMNEILTQKFGEENVISSVVHKDESEKGKSHMHFKFMPIIKMNKPKNGYTEKLCAKEVVNRSMLLTFHQDIEKDFKDILKIDLSLRRSEKEKRPYVNDIYEFKDIQEDYEIAQNELKQTRQDLQTEKQNLAQTKKELVEAFTAYKQLEEQHNKMVDAFNNLQEILDKVRKYFNRYYDAILPALEDDARKNLQELDKDLDELQI